MPDIILPDRKHETLELYYPERKPVGNVRWDFPKMKGSWINFNKANSVSGVKSTLTSSGLVKGGDLITDGVARAMSLDESGDDALWPSFSNFSYFIRFKLLTTPVNGTNSTIFTNATKRTANYFLLYSRVNNGGLFKIIGAIGLLLMDPGSYEYAQDDWLNVLITRNSAGLCGLYVNGELKITITNSEEIYNRHGSNFHVLGAGTTDIDPSIMGVESCFISHEHIAPQKAIMLTKTPYQFLIPS